MTPKKAKLPLVETTAPETRSCYSTFSHRQNDFVCFSIWTKIYKNKP